jgi:dTMP kinase
MYIAFEGIVGSGKTTQVKKLVDYLRANGKRVTQIREPGSTPIAEDIRYLAQWKVWESEEMHPLTNAYLYTAARAQTLHTIVNPALLGGYTVVADRCFLSSCVIQWEAQWLGIERVIKINAEVVRDILPDTIIYLDIDIDLALSRTGDPLWDKFEKKDKEFYEAIVLGYDKCEKYDELKNRFIRIDANGTEEDIFSRILENLTSRSCL